MDGVERSLPNPHDPTLAIDQLARIDRLTIAQRVDELDLDDEHREVLWAELESLAHGPLDEAGAASVLRWHALSGYSLALTQYTGGRVTLTNGHPRAAGGDRRRCRVRDAAVHAGRGGETARRRRRGGDARGRAAAGGAGGGGRAAEHARRRSSSNRALSELKLEGIALGQASRGIKIFIHAEGEPISQNAIRPGHPFGYLDTEFMNDDGTQVMIGFGYDAALNDATDLPRVQGDLDRIIPGYRAVDASAHDWLADEFSRGTWAIHRPGWYSRYYEEMRRPEGPVLLAGSDLAAGWSGFIDGAIESGLRAGAWLRQTGP